MGCEKHQAKGEYDKKYPFYCKKCGGIDFPYTPTLDRVFLLPLIPETYDEGLIQIPIEYSEFYKKPLGIVLSVGRGYWLDSGKFKPTQVKPGQKVYYDNTVPWTHKFEDREDNEHEVTRCGEGDIHGIM